MYILTFVFKLGIKAERLGPQEIILFILQSQAGPAALTSYPSDVLLLLVSLRWRSQSVLAQLP